jgi:hypothetical protein
MTRGVVWKPRRYLLIAETQNSGRMIKRAFGLNDDWDVLSVASNFSGRKYEKVVVERKVLPEIDNPFGTIMSMVRDESCVCFI